MNSYTVASWFIALLASWLLAYALDLKAWQELLCICGVLTLGYITVAGLHGIPVDGTLIGVALPAMAASTVLGYGAFLLLAWIYSKALKMFGAK